MRKAFGMIGLLISGAIFVFVLMLGEAMPSMFGASKDGFADNLSLPTGIDLTEPVPFSRATDRRRSDSMPDSYQRALMDTLEIPASGSSEVTANLPNFEHLANHHPDILIRYLGASPGWRVFRERGATYATCRLLINGEWRYKLHGFYTHHDVENAPESFQFRFTIGLDGTPWVGNIKGATMMKVGETKNLSIGRGADKMEESHCVVSAGPMIIECYEQSHGKERRLTKAAFAHFEAELDHLARAPTYETIESIHRPDVSRKGKPDIRLIGSRGNYAAEVRVNPGEPGFIYLKAHEITKEKQISGDRLRQKSNERVNWSTDPDELFFSKTRFTIYEGDWGQYYGARFEVWFAPDSGKPDRKLFEENFKIEGWMR